MNPLQSVSYLFEKYSSNHVIGAGLWGSSFLANRISYFDFVTQRIETIDLNVLYDKYIRSGCHKNILNDSKIHPDQIAIIAPMIQRFFIDKSHKYYPEPTNTQPSSKFMRGIAETHKISQNFACVDCSKNSQLLTNALYQTIKLNGCPRHIDTTLLNLQELFNIKGDPVWLMKDRFRSLISLLPSEKDRTIFNENIEKNRYWDRLVRCLFQIQKPESFIHLALNHSFDSVVNAKTYFVQIGGTSHVIDLLELLRRIYSIISVDIDNHCILSIIVAFSKNVNFQRSGFYHAPRISSPFAKLKFDLSSNEIKFQTGYPLLYQNDQRQNIEDTTYSNLFTCKHRS
jgi:hypothetical protein